MAPNENTEESQAVLAYRVKKLEEAVDHGFQSMNTKLDKLGGFITKEDSDKIIRDEWIKANQIQAQVNKRIDDVEIEVNSINDWKNSIINKIAYSAIIMFVLMVLALYGLDKFFR